MPDRTLTVRIVGDDASLRRAFATSEKSAQTFQGRISGVGVATSRSFLAAGVAAGAAAVSFQAVTRGIGASVDEAVNLSEQVSKSRQIFGESSREIEQWSSTTARAFGISQAAALEATGTFGNLFRTVGLAPTAASEMSRALVQLAADLASFNNADPSDVLQAIRSGLIGEAEPLRRYGVLLSEAKVQQLAMSNTGKTNVRSLTDQEKALARYQIILRDTAPAQGDFARTSDGLANKTRILKANMNDLSAEIGQVLIPGLSDAADATLVLFDALGKIPGALNAIEDAIPGARSSLLDLVGIDADFDFGTSGIDVLRGALGGDEDREPVRAPSRGLGDERSTPEEIVAEQARDRVERAKTAKRDLERSQREFNALTKGLGLKFDKAGLTESLADDLAALRELERAILRQIEREGKTFALVDQLTRVRSQILQTTAAQADRQAAESRAATERIIEARRKEAEDRRRLVEELQRQRQEDQFEALGLTAEGEQRVPGRGALRSRLADLREQVKGTALDTDKTRSQLQGIAKVLTGQFGAVGRDVRSAILQMFNDIADALEEGSGTSGPLTKFQKTGANKLLEGLGLSEEEVKALRQRLSQVGPGGTVPSMGTGAFGINVGAPSTLTGGGNIIINGNLNVQARDADAFVREVQKRAGRSASSRRGTRPGSNRGMG